MKTYSFVVSEIADEIETTMRQCVSAAPGVASIAAIRHLNAGGSRIRARIAVSAAHALGLAPSDALAISAAVELLHNASLVHDDLQDRSPSRRGQESLWVAFGDDTALCAGDLMISSAYGAISTLSPWALPAAISHMHAGVSRVISGQTADLTARHAPITSLADYERIAVAKSAPLLALPIELSLIAAGQPEFVEQVAQAARSFALAYQMADDIADAEDDLASGDLNVVGVLNSEIGISNSAATARTLTIQHYLQAAKIARALPLHCGAMIADQAERAAAYLTEDAIQ